MAIWRLDSDTTGEVFDDGLPLMPGDPGFTRARAEAHFGTPAFSWVGTPDWWPETLLAGATTPAPLA